MSKLFSEIKVGGLTLKNRVVVPPMCQYQAIDGVVQPWHLIHLGSMVTSGAGLVILEATGIEARGRISPNCLGIYTDEQEQAFKDLLQTLRRYSDAKIGIQLCHAGRKASTLPFDKFMPADVDHGGWVDLIGPSDIKIQPEWAPPHPMTLTEIDETIAAYVSAARRADRAGFDLIEVHGAHGYLVSQFLSPMANQRTDQYGGSLENRMRFGIRVAEALREAWPQSKGIGFRLNGTDWIDGGITTEETVEFSKRLKQAGIDYVTVSGGGNSRQQKRPTETPGYQVDMAAQVKRESGITTMAIGMIVEPEQANAILERGEADFIGVARATLDDPRWALHAAQALSDEPDYPASYWRLTRKLWPGYDIVHPAAAHQNG